MAGRLGVSFCRFSLACTRALKDRPYDSARQNPEETVPVLVTGENSVGKMVSPRDRNWYKMAVAVPVRLELRRSPKPSPWLSTCINFFASTRRARPWPRFFHRFCRPASTQSLSDTPTHRSLVRRHDTNSEPNETAPPQRMTIMNGVVEAIPIGLSSRDLLDRCDG